MDARKLTDKIILLKEMNSIKRHYRFADVTKHLGYYWKESTLFILNQPHMKNTILRKYIEQCPNNNLNSVNPNKLRLLYDIIKQDKIVCSPTADELVIHLRLGDVIEFDWYLKKDYIKIIQHYVDTHNIKKVTFCTAFHYGNNIVQKLHLYSDELHRNNKIRVTNLFKNVLETFTELEINVKSSADIDEDFLYMINATHFVKDNGGFSGLIEELIHYKNSVDKNIL